MVRKEKLINKAEFPLVDSNSAVFIYLTDVIDGRPLFVSLEQFHKAVFNPQWYYLLLLSDHYKVAKDVVAQPVINADTTARVKAMHKTHIAVQENHLLIKRTLNLRDNFCLLTVEFQLA